jgi:hypothetical protein
MTADYGHFWERSSVGVEPFGYGRPGAGWIQPTPSFFCRLDDEVVYWNTSRLSG